MMKRFLLVSLSLLLAIGFTCFVHSSALALTLSAPTKEEKSLGFQHLLSGTAELGDGTKVEIHFPLAFEQVASIWYFRAGNQKVPMSLPPHLYNLQFAVQEKDAMVFIGEFSDRYMRHFKVSIAGHELELLPASSSKYGLRLRLDDRVLMFDKRTPALRIELDAYGIVGFQFDGFVRDLSSRRVD